MAKPEPASVPADRTLREADARPVEDGVLHLVVMGANHFSMHPLPERGAVSIGRDDSDDVRIDDPQASRRHARLHVEGQTLEIEDLRSANGTRVRGAAIAPGQRVAVLPGEAISIGWATLMIQRRRPVVAVRPLPTHTYFEARLEEECERATASSGAFGVLRLHLAPGTPAGTTREVVATLLRPGDVLAVYGPDEYELLLSEPDRERARSVAGRIERALERRGIAARTGLACFPVDARTAEALIAAACERVLGPVTPEPPLPDELRLGPEMRRVHLLARRAAVSNINVLILGETGVGKEVFAETIHALSPRAEKPLVRLNCAALAPALLESELFGHERAAFTDAGEAKPGLLESAQGGTVLLDEIGELPAAIQAKLLRVIETREVMRVGALKPRAIDVRFVAATNRVLEDDVARGTFRQDLYYRLNGISLLIPPLRSRREEIGPLARSFLETAAKREERSLPALSLAAREALEAYAWPGNVRELRNVIERAVLISDGETITPEDLPLEKMRAAPAPALLVAPAASPPGGEPATSRSEYERIVDSLARCNGNQTRAAKLLGMPRRTFCARLKAYNIPRPRG
jgi:DNA-binding NtrC family response regulator